MSNGWCDFNTRHASLAYQWYHVRNRSSIIPTIYLHSHPPLSPHRIMITSHYSLKKICHYLTCIDRCPPRAYTHFTSSLTPILDLSLPISRDLRPIQPPVSTYYIAFSVAIHILFAFGVP